MSRLRGNRSALIAGIASFLVFGLASFAFAATFIGNPGPDSWGGTPQDDYADGKGGGDDLSTQGGNDTIYGGDQGDRLDGEGGVDSIYGEKGDDTIRSGDSINGMIGNEGDDEVYGTNGSSFLNALEGNADDDFLDARNGQTDQEVNGGAGYDVCYYGAADAPYVTNCEDMHQGP